MGAPIVAASDRSESFLTCRVPLKEQKYQTQYHKSGVTDNEMTVSGAVTAVDVDSTKSIQSCGWGD